MIDYDSDSEILKMLYPGVHFAHWLDERKRKVRFYVEKREVEFTYLESEVVQISCYGTAVIGRQRIILWRFVNALSEDITSEK